MRQFEVEVEYVEEKSIMKYLIEGHNHSALEKVSQQLKEWGEEV